MTNLKLDRITTFDFVEDPILSNTGSFCLTYNKEVYIWETFSGRLINILLGHDKMIKDISISENDQYIATYCVEKKLKIWKVQYGELIYSCYNEDTKHGFFRNNYAYSYTPEKTKISFFNFKCGAGFEVNMNNPIHDLVIHNNKILINSIQNISLIDLNSHNTILDIDNDTILSLSVWLSNDYLYKKYENKIYFYDILNGEVIYEYDTKNAERCIIKILKNYIFIARKEILKIIDIKQKKELEELEYKSIILDMVVNTKLYIMLYDNIHIYDLK